MGKRQYVNANPATCTSFITVNSTNSPTTSNTSILTTILITTITMTKGMKVKFLGNTEVKN